MNTLMKDRWLGFCFMLTMGLASAQLAAAAESVNETLDVDADSLIEIRHVSGEAKIIGWDQSKVQVSGELGENTEEFNFERDGKSVIIEVKVKKSKSGWGWNNNSDPDDLTIYVPHNSHVDYHSSNAQLEIEQIKGSSDIELINGDLRATNLSGKVRLKTTNGDIRAIELRGDVTLDSVNGDIKAEQTSGDEIKINTVNGDIDVKASASQVSAETVNGDIDYIGGEVSEVPTNTVNGRIRMSMSLIEGGRARASSVSGKINLAFQPEIEAKFNIQIHAGGSIINNLTSDKPQKAKYGPRKWLEFSKGNPTATVDVSSVNGRVEIKAK